MTNPDTESPFLPNTVLDESLLPSPTLISDEERRSITRLLKYEAWAWFQAFTNWIPGKVGWIVRHVLYRPFFQRASKNWHIAEHASIQPPGRFQIGEASVVSRYCTINAIGGVIIGDHGGMGPFCILVTSNHRFPNRELPLGYQTHLLETAPIVFESNVWVGAGCIILPGVRIGKYSIVAAGSVVTKDVPRYTLVAGVPAKVIRTIDPSEFG